MTNCAQTKNGSRMQRQALGAQLHDRDDEVDRAEQRRGDQEDHADQPHRLAVGAMTASGGYDVQPDCAAPPGWKKLASIVTPPTKYTQ